MVALQVAKRFRSVRRQSNVGYEGVYVDTWVRIDDRWRLVSSGCSVFKLAGALTSGVGRRLYWTTFALEVVLVISRVWHGWTTSENAPDYERLLRTEILPGIAAKELAGYRGSHLLRRELEGEVEFMTILWFESLDGVRALAGEDYEVAYVPPRARALLSRFDAKSQHYDTVLIPDPHPA
jgi:hypothetical protein